MFRKVGIALFGACIFLPPANAADLGGSLKDPPIYVAPFSWTGLYLGANAGYGWGSGHGKVTPLPDAATFIYLEPQTFHPDASGGVWGGQLGYNWQRGNFVFGLEADIQGAGIDGTDEEAPIVMNDGTALPAGGRIHVKQKLDWFGTVRARAGLLAFSPRAMLYATGGLAYGHVKNSANAVFPNPTFGALAPGEEFPASFGETRTGWVLGGGLEMAVSRNWSFRVEYLHIDLGSMSETANASPSDLLGRQIKYSFDDKTDIVRAGVNYKLW